MHNSTPLILRQLRATVLAASATALLYGCDGRLSQNDNQNDSQMQMTPPVQVSSSRAIELSQLSAVITVVNDGRTISMTRQDNNTWTSIIRLPPNTQQPIQIDWFERYKGQSLELARANTQVSVGAEASTENLDDLTYDTSFDRDEDGKTNLEERNRSTDPFNPPQPGLEGINVVVPRIDAEAAPAIDGQGVIYDSNVLRLVGEWATAAQQDLLDDTLYIENLMIDINSDQRDGDPFHRWAAVHDGTWLYLLVVNDDIGLHQGDSSDPSQDDNLEIYIDGNNSKNNKYEDADDILIQMPLLEKDSTLPNSHLSANRRVSAGFNSAPIPEEIEFWVGLGTGPLSFRGSSQRQDVYEVRMRIADLGITIGQPFGIELQIDDDDNGGERDAKWGWFHRSRTTADTDETWKNPSLMGTAILAQ